MVPKLALGLKFGQRASLGRVMGQWHWGALVGLLAVVPSTLPGQQTAPIRVYLDCQNLHCDFDHFRRAVGWVDWVRDRRDAEVHVLGTAQATGGGREYTFTFLGLQRFAGQADTLRHASSGTDTDAEVRDALARTLALGLVRFAARTDLARRLSVAFRPDSGTLAPPARDPWNLWIFRLGLSAEMEGESRQESQEYEAEVSAGRVTEGFKVDFGARGEYGRERFDLDDGTRIVSTSNDWEVEGIAVWSLGSHWSAGVLMETGASTFSNRDFRLEGGPTLEFNVFPYAQSTRRRFVVALTAGLTYYDYAEVTIFGRTSELRPAHVMEVGVSRQEPWGQIDASAQWFQYWHDWRRHRVELNAGIELRLVRGLSLDVFGNVARVKDQLFLSRENLTSEEVLLELRELGTDFRYAVGVGLSFTFGSIYNNIVNPRIRN